MVLNKFYFIQIILFLFVFNINIAQDDSYFEDESEDYEEFEYLSPLNDKTLEGQKIFVKELLDLSGYILKSIEVYQTLPNNAKVFRVKLEANEGGGFVFVRWDKKKKENFIANKLIDSRFYYNLKASKEIMRKQTELKSFGTNDIALQAEDQEKLNKREIEQLRQEFDLKEKEKEVKKLNLENKKTRKKNKKRKN